MELKSGDADLKRYEFKNRAMRAGGAARGLSREIVVGGLPPTTRPDFEIARALREFKAVPTALASRSPALLAA